MEKAKDLYSSYSEKTQQDMQNVLDCLSKDYKKIPTSWRMSLNLIADNYEIYNQAKERVLNEGLIRTDKLGRTFKNQSFPLMISTEQNLLKLLKAFGLSPVYQSGVKKKADQEEDVEDILMV